MELEFDENKGAINKRKHGIDFVEAQVLWKDPYLLEIPAKETDEVRFRVVGRILDKWWTAVITYRKETVRVISVRPARRKEVEDYERAKENLG